MPVPSPRRLDLFDAETTDGWIDDMAIGFRGYANEADAARAALVAYRTMERRLAGDGGRSPLPHAHEPMSVERSGDLELILAGGRPIATLLRPSSVSPSGPDSFGFSLPFPVPSDELTRRSTAYVVFRELRRLGIHGTAWEPVLPSTYAGEDGESDPDTVVGARPPTARHADNHLPASRRSVSRDTAATALVVGVLLVAILLPAIALSSTAYLLAGTIVIALAGLAPRLWWGPRAPSRGRIVSSGVFRSRP